MTDVHFRSYDSTNAGRHQLPGILHTIFFHRYFPCIRPASLEVLDLTLPAIDDVNVESYIDSRVNTLIQQHLSSSSNASNGGVRGRVAVQFFEKKRRKTGLWFGAKNEEQTCWETWTINITIAVPRTESGMASYFASTPLAHFADYMLCRTYQGPQGHGEDATESSF